VSQTSPLHIVFGAGQVGSSLAIALKARGLRVRVVRRSGRPVAPGVEVLAADATDPAQAVAAARGAAVVYHCMNPSAYTEQAWQAEFPAQGEALIAAAQATGARLVCLDNLYACGPCGGPRSEQTPLAAEGPKGWVRVAWDARLRQAGEQGLRWTAGRAGDDFGPGAGGQSLLSMQAVAALGRGWPAVLVGDADAVHAFSWVPDVVEALVALGSAADDVEGRAWHLPVHPVAPRELVQRLARAQGRRGWTVVLAPWFIRLLGRFSALAHALEETLYQWDRPFLVDDSAFRARFPALGLSLDQAVTKTVAAALPAGSPPFARPSAA